MMKMQQKHLERLKSLGKRSDFPFESAHHLVAHVYRVLYDILPHSDSKVSPSIPASLGSLFKGRENWFAKIREEVKKARGADSVRVVLHGIGGIGKTQLVSEYAMACAHEHSVVHLIRGDSKDSFDAGLAELCGVLDLPQSDSVNPKEQIKAALRWLDQEENKGWMLLIDNIDDDAMVTEIVQEAKKLHRGVILITSRWGSWPHGFIDLELDLLPEEPAIDYLLEATESKRISLDEELGQGTDRRKAKEIVESLGQLALGLAQAAATINNCRWSFREYQVQWSIARDSLLEDPDFDPVIVGYPRAVGMTWLTTYQRLSAESKLVFDILCWLMPAPIPERLITKAWPVEALEKLDNSVRQSVESKLRKLMIPLYDYSLASNPIGSQRLFKVHKLVQEVGRIWQFKAAANPVAKDLARLLLDREFVREDNLDNIRLNILPELRPMALHARGMYKSLAASDSPYLASRAFRMLSEIAQTEGRYADAGNESTRSVDLARQSRSTHASGEFNLAESLSVLCQTLDSRGYFDNALQAGEEQRKILEELCTKEPENLAQRRELGIALNNVGRVLEKKGDNDGALTLFSKSQAISDELCTKEPENLAHRRDLGIACFWVGSALAKLQRWQESSDAFEKAIKATQAVIDAGGSFGSLKGNLDAMTSWLQHVRDQINKK
jgi:tetratricopeptide (TPR) repeat protein